MMNLTAFSQDEFKKALQSALVLDVPYSDWVHRDLSKKMAEQVKPAAVLILFAYSRIQTGPAILFTRRAESVETHKGQMAFPGGHCEPDDGNRPPITALRETEEEVGIPSENVHVFGVLPSLVTVTGYLIQPVVGILKSSLEDISLRLDASETAEALWVPLEVLLHPETYRREFILVGEVQFPIDVYQVEQHRIWGATGSMTKNLLDRLISLG